MNVILHRVFIVLAAGILGYGMALGGQFIWTALLVINLAASPAIPWAVVVMIPVLVLIWLYLDGKGWPRSTSAARHRYLRAKVLSRGEFAWAFLSGAFAIIALADYWITIARIVRMPGNGLPEMTKYPLLTVALAVAMGSLISPVLEQAGFWGYTQAILEQRLPGAAVIMIMSALYAIGPHPPASGPLWPRLIFYFLAGATFSLLSYYTQSLLPGLAVHILGILAFFTLVWPYDPTRLLIGQSGVDIWFWIVAALGILVTILAALAFIRLAIITGHVQGRISNFNRKIGPNKVN
jgi:membrane protease YdiL (CAAX protease family)